MKSKHLTASTLRTILYISLVLIYSLGAALFYVANTKLKEVATVVSHTIADSNASQNDIQTLQAIQKKLATEQETVNRVNSIIADSKSYQYQNQIIADLNRFAEKADVTITNFDFSSAANSPAAKSVPTAAAPLTKPMQPVGVKSTSVSVTLVNPIAYNNLLRFIKSIEQNLTKMQLSTISLSKGPTAGKVTTDSLIIEVYIR